MTDDTRRDVVEREYWTCDNWAEQLSCQSLDEAVEEYLDGASVTDGVIDVFRYRPLALPETLPDAAWILETALEYLDEEYGNPEERTEPSEGMKEAAAAFAAVIREQYHVWSCECVETVPVDVAKWIREHRPDWRDDTRRDRH